MCGSIKLDYLGKLLKVGQLILSLSRKREKKLIAEYDLLDILSETQPLSPGAKEQMKKIAGEL
jgi:hypothetical protein